MSLQPVQSHGNQFLECPHAVSSSVVAAFKFFIIFEQAAPCFYFALGSVYYVGPAQIQALPVVIVSLLLPWSKPRPHLV